MVIYRILLVLDWTGQNVACYEIESTTFQEPSDHLTAMRSNPGTISYRTRSWRARN